MSRRPPSPRRGDDAAGPPSRPRRPGRDRDRDDERDRPAPRGGRPPHPVRGDGREGPPARGGRPFRPGRGRPGQREERPAPLDDRDRLERRRPSGRGRPPADAGAAAGEDPRPPRPERPFRPARPVAGRPSRSKRERERKNEEYLEQRRRTEKDKGLIWTPGPNARTIRAEAGLDLAHFVVQFTKGRLSVRAARALLEDGCCRINGRIETFGSRKLAAGEVVEVILPPEPTEHRFDAKRVLFSDEWLLAYDKPAFLPVTPTDGAKSWSLTDILRGSIEGDVIPVHRLDADTSGIVLFARKERTARRLEELFAEHGVAKTYRAIVRGHPPEHGLRRTYLIKVESGQGFERWKSGKGRDAREAVTEWQVEARLGRYGSLVKVEPRTGRYHQIRIHFSEIRHPLYGDRQYGDRLDPVHVHRHLLHASAVALVHPETGAPLRIECPLPRDMREAMEQLSRI